ncbi:RluA family pseudouridine synthase [Fredinandcohnia sp. QZ13]|uniref:RluA family pseudouridine synthase n=1 Tax=Fredinandcohnia sp. QZ13 TaxID=3073144 RepID=UPI0028530FF6|nr:RluA family pseudouridine synthase [Fredinandcohnia sp. QZ13]MDR4887283.1 RluA family pseudouridine synthase [Fredinandcohnia sp. QZ13]
MLTKRVGEWFEIQVSKDWEGMTIEDVLKNVWSMPKQMLHQLRMEKGVKLKGEAKPWNTTLTHNDKLQVHLFLEEEFGVKPEYVPDLHILFEDDHLLIVNKPPGMDTHPNEDGQIGTLANAVAYHFQMNGIQTKVRHIHRLDHDTTGAVIFAKHKLASAILDRRLEKREIKRTYLALVHGIIKQKKGTIEDSIGRDRHHPTRRRVSPTGQKAITKFQVLQTVVNKKMTLVELELLTGRTHQIRVHMSHLGYPLVGDTLYGGQPIVQRQALHAARIQLEHPLTNEKILCEAPFLDSPPIFEKIVD